MNDEAALEVYLDDNPDDALGRYALADLFEERGDLDAAHCQRWLADQRLWPDANLKPFSLTGWHWWSCPDRPHFRRAHAVLPEDVQAHMPFGEWLYSTRKEAEAVLARALVRMGETRRWPIDEKGDRGNSASACRSN
jgi:hypothetical protein